MAVDDQRVVIEKQRIVIQGRVGEVPDLLGQEIGILWMDAPLVIEGDEHLVGCTLPLPYLVVDQPGVVHEAPVGVGVGLLEPGDDFGGVAQIRTGHKIREGVVVDDRGVLVGPGDPVDMEGAGVGAEESQSDPHAGGFHQDLRADLGEQLRISANIDVALDRVGDVGVYVVLRRARGIVGGGLLAVYRAPREEAPVL